MLVHPKMLSDNYRGRKKPADLSFFRFEDSPKGFHGQWVIQVGTPKVNDMIECT